MHICGTVVIDGNVFNGVIGLHVTSHTHTHTHTHAHTQIYIVHGTVLGLTNVNVCNSVMCLHVTAHRYAYVGQC